MCMLASLAHTTRQSPIISFTLVVAFGAGSLFQPLSAQANDIARCGSGEPEGRIVACTQIIKRAGVPRAKLAAAYDGRCWAYNLAGDHRSAVKDCEKAISLDPGYPYAYNNLGVALEKLGLTEKAILNFKKSLSLKPSFQAARDNLSRFSGTQHGDNPGLQPTPERSNLSPACEKYPDLC